MQEIDIGASCPVRERGARSTTEGAEIELDVTTDGSILKDVGTIGGGPIADPTGFLTPYPPFY